MASPRLFGFQPTEKRAGEAAGGHATVDPLETLADRVFETSQDLPMSTAWRMSQAKHFVRHFTAPEND